MPRRSPIDPIIEELMNRSLRSAAKSEELLRSDSRPVDYARLSVEMVTLLSASAKDAEVSRAETDPLSTLSGDEFEQVIADLMAAHSDAIHAGDTETIQIIENALRVIGRHLASALGPKGSGMRTN